MRRKRTQTPEQPGENAEAAGGKGGRKKKLLIAAVAALLVAAGAFVFLKPGGGAAEAAKAPEPGAVVRLDPITLNLADGHYLKVGVALQMVKTDAKAEGETDAAAVGAKALDEVIAQLGERTMPELAGPGGRAKAKAKLTAAVSKRYHGEVMDVYFTEFVMQ